MAILLLLILTHHLYLLIILFVLLRILLKHLINLRPASTSYDPYASLNTSFHNFPISFFNLLIFLLTLAHCLKHLLILFSTLTSQPPPLGLQVTPSVPFAALSNHIKLFDGLDPPENCLAHLSARVAFPLGPQTLDLQSYLI